MRLFVAVEIDSGIGERLASFTSELQRRTARLAPRARVTWIPADRLHLTLRFIGEVEHEQALTITAALAPCLRAARFEITFEGAGAFPARGTPKVLWAGISRGADRLQALEQEISGRLVACGVAREERTYRPHLTLARIREASGMRPGTLFEGLDGRSFGAMRVDAITLFESRLSPKGPTYVSLQRTPLAKDS